MCSIIGSFSKTKFKELVKLNQNRGSFSYSFLVLDPISLETISLTQNFNEFNLNIIDSAPVNMYYLGHTQAPTGGLVKKVERIHPAKINDFFLFHNGIIKQKDVERLQQLYDINEEWDSKLMLSNIYNIGLLEALNTIDGSFACVFNDMTSLRIFRSAAGILFVDDSLNISSTKFDNSTRIEKDTIYELDLKNRKLLINNNFVSKSNPYFY